MSDPFSSERQSKPTNGQIEMTSRSTPARLQRYRQRNRRYEFYPSPDVADIIEHHLTTGAEKCLAGVLDGLIRAGHRAVTGNGRAK